MSGDYEQIRMLVNEEYLTELDNSTDDALDIARRYSGHPPEPEKLHVKEQLQSHLDRVTPEKVTVEVNDQFQTTFARVRDDGQTLSVNWDLFDREQYYDDVGWPVICFVAKEALKQEGLPTGGL